MKVETILHKSGDLLPLLIDSEGMPIPASNEFIISRRSLSPNTLVRNLRELSILYLWPEKEHINLESRISSKYFFNEAEIKGGLVEYLRRDHEKCKKIKILTITPNTFNQRLTTIRQFLIWYIDIMIGALTYSSSDYDHILHSKQRLLALLDTSFINAPPINKSQNKGLNKKEIDFLLTILDTESNQSYGKISAVRYRNYILTMIMLYYGL